MGTKLHYYTKVIIVHLSAQYSRTENTASYHTRILYTKYIFYILLILNIVLRYKNKSIFQSIPRRTPNVLDSLDP